MTMFYIVLLIFFGLLFLVAELVLLPGVSMGAMLALVCYGSSIYTAFADSAPWPVGVVVLVILVLSLIATVVSLRAKTWQRFSLKQKINSSSMPTLPEQELSVGDRGTTVSRLSPMGKIEVNGGFTRPSRLGRLCGPRRTVEVVGFENFNVVVRKVADEPSA